MTAASTPDEPRGRRARPRRCRGSGTTSSPARRAGSASRSTAPSTQAHAHHEQALAPEVLRDRDHPQVTTASTDGQRQLQQDSFAPGHSRHPTHGRWYRTMTPNCDHPTTGVGSGREGTRHGSARRRPAVHPHMLRRPEPPPTSQGGARVDTPFLRVEETGDVFELDRRADHGRPRRGRRPRARRPERQPPARRDRPPRRAPLRAGPRALDERHPGQRPPGRAAGPRRGRRAHLRAWPAPGSAAWSAAADDADDTVELRKVSAPDLTRREVEVLTALCRPALQQDAFVAPATAREIADELVVTEAAVKQHLLRLYQKFRVPEGVNRRARLANDVISAGVIRPLPPGGRGDASPAPADRAAPLSPAPPSARPRRAAGHLRCAASLTPASLARPPARRW